MSFKKMKESNLFFGLTMSLIVLLIVSLTLNLMPCNGPEQNNCPALEIKAAPLYPALEIKNTPLISNLDNNQTLVYELFIKTYSPVEFAKIEIVDSGSNVVLKTLSGDYLNASLRNVPRDNSAFAALLWLNLPKQQIPSSIYHRVYFRQNNEEEPISGAAINISTEELAISGPPLKGDKWLAASAPPGLTVHRKALIMLQGLDFFPERYAIDWMRYGPDNLLYKNEGAVNEDYYCYGSDLLAVSDGRIVDAKDGIPDNKPLEYPKNLPLVNYGGNYVVLEIDQNHYAFYAHLIPGSIKVKIGDEVKKGQVIGKLGNSGNSDAPHLHFHVCSSQNFLFSEGLPYLFDSYSLEGASRNWEKDWVAGNLSWNKFSSPQKKVSTMPIDGDIIGFPEFQ
ncbi:MAG: M23 family metallopeptidase [archaeon]